MTGWQAELLEEPCGFFYLLSSFFARLISAVTDWMSTILPHMVWPLCEFRMQVWNMLHAARWKCRMQKNCKNSPSGHHHTTLSGYIFTTRAHIDNQKKVVKEQYLPHVLAIHGELRPPSTWDLLASLGRPSKFKRVSLLGCVTAWHYSGGCLPNFEALNRGCHIYSAGRPSRWALAQILV